MRRDYLELSKLSYDILPEFYNCFKCSKKKMLKIIINLFKKPNSEFNKCYIFWKKKEIVGLISLINSRKILKAQLIGLKEILINLNKKEIKNKKLEKLKKNFQILKNHGLYITRIGIKKKYFGKYGLSNFLLQTLLRNEKYNIVAHVNRRNIRAIKYYKKNNFKFFPTKKLFLFIEHKKTYYEK